MPRCCYKCGIELSQARDHSYCRACHNSVQAAWRKKNKERNAEIYRKAVLKSKYGLSQEEVDKMIERQQGKCAICGRTQKRRLVIDHCHKSGKVRGLLCYSCNSALGLLKDDPQVLSKAIWYLANG